MNKIKVLDCTLRDGGYVDNWKFGCENIKKIILKLIDANINIVECGFLTDKKHYSNDYSKFDSIQKITDFLPKDRQNVEMVCMINYGEYNLKDIPEYDGSSVDGIRVAFHKSDLKGALEFCKGIVQKGYKLFMQPMVSVSYTDYEFIKLIEEANEIKPYAFYIVDSFGVMKRKDLMRLFYLVDHNLEEDIYVGYHSHNNIQLAYSNAQALIDLKIKRKLIIDSSVFGMGRGAGNLNTELFIEYLNDINGGEYKSRPLLQIIDEVLTNIYLSNYWGYSLPHYISAKHNCHPNYASYLADKNTLTVEDISNILSFMDEVKKNNFNKEYIENLYFNYQSHKIDDNIAISKLKEIFNDKKVIAIAPGSSINDYVDEIRCQSSMMDTIIVAVNFEPEKIKGDYLFISNLRRYEELKDKIKNNLIFTSNIKLDNNAEYIINYIDLLNEIPAVRDNAGLMLIRLLINLGVKSIKLAGYDGYSYDAYENYVEKDMAFIKKHSVVDELNEGMKRMLNQFSRQVEIEFITKTKYF
ncbi:aldolase catalytic domain-containing protein [Clostridium sp. SHJSY1]|uniref:aldolase catalytic domain-containing protein n=1 Tax=Clostridium sp. SHJSY1 TaxID=2942483 RepID=UPI002876A563|nr:aldolase catalytic domain-containing protein [Clostridium sp. SHJSY1]MDS0526531.1 aldolase catalytic domain-containing protein [Clostridium sp. SHJSY1]